MSKHTPGPWHYQKCPCGMNGCHQYTISVQWSKGFVEADARLIAAAPDLLEALKMAVRQNEHDMLMTGEELRQCEAAIAKAEGA